MIKPTWKLSLNMTGSAQPVFDDIMQLVAHYETVDAFAGLSLQEPAKPPTTRSPTKMEEQSWFLGSIERLDCEALLLSPACGVGSFGIRTGSVSPYVLSVREPRAAKVKHFKIECTFSLQLAEKSKPFPDMMQLVAHYKSVGNFAGISLTQPAPNPSVSKSSPRFGIASKTRKTSSSYVEIEPDASGGSQMTSKSNPLYQSDSDSENEDEEPEFGMPGDNIMPGTNAMEVSMAQTTINAMKKHGIGNADAILSYATGSLKGGGLRFCEKMSKFLDDRRISNFHGRMVKAGDNWQTIWYSKMDTAKVAILMLSPEFFKSEACVSETEKILQKKGLKDRVIPIFLEPVSMDGDFLGTTTRQQQLAAFFRVNLAGNSLPPPDKGTFPNNYDTNMTDLTKRVIELLHAAAEDEAEFGALPTFASPQRPMRQPSRGVPEDPFVDALFNLMDTNNNDFVSKMEFLEFIRVNKPKHGPFASTAKLQTVFGLLKANNINREDFQRVFATESGLDVSLFNVELSIYDEPGRSNAQEKDATMDGLSAEEQEQFREFTYTAAIEAAQTVVQVAKIKYLAAYEKHLNESPGNVIGQERFEMVADKIVKVCKGPVGVDCLKVVLLQPDFGVAKDQRKRYMLTCRREFCQAMVKSDKALMAIAIKAKAIFKTGPTKSDERWVEKASIAYSDNLRRMTDIERRSFVCDDFDEIRTTLQLVHAEFEILRIKNRFAMGYDAKDTAGYRDCQVLCYALGNKLMFEIQIHLACIFQLKDEILATVGPDGRSGHQKYLEFRALKEAADADKRNGSC
jgi:hypothetical protein